MVVLSVFDVTGRIVRTLVNRKLAAGVHEVTWDGTSDAGSVLIASVLMVLLSAPGFLRPPVSSANHPTALPEPVILSVDDIPNDGGTSLRVTWNHSRWDWHPYHDVRYYWLYRHVPGSEPYWQKVGSEFAQAISTYSSVAPAVAPNRYTTYMVRAVSLDGLMFWDSAPDSGFALDNVSETGDPPAAAALWLGAAFPNPTRGAASIRFWLPEAGRVTLSIHDVRGRLVRTLLSSEVPAGAQEARWDGRWERGDEAAPGIYFYSLRSAGGTLSGRLCRVR